LTNVKIWKEDIYKICPGIPIIIVGNKLELLPKHTKIPIDASAIAKEVNACSYVECSAVAHVVEHLITEIIEVYQHSIANGRFYQNNKFQ